VITLSNYLGNKPYNRKIALLGFIASHTQLLVGLILFFYLKYPSMISGAVMKDPTLRFKIIEHPLTMIIAIVLITIGYSKAKKIENAKKANQTVVIFYIIGLILILSRIPWSTWSLFA
jgi:membrane-associated HD superfamily phosphohydrolase